jgi:hypothetical protein
VCPSYLKGDFHLQEVEPVEKVYAPIVVIALVALSILTGLVVKELKTLNTLMQNFEVDRMKIRLEDLGLRKKAG